jgi:hypothetical protein
MRAWLGVEAEGAEGAEILELGKAFAVETVERVSSGRCLNCHHGVRVWWRRKEVGKQVGIAAR